MKKSYLLLLAVAASFTFVSCDDEEDVQPTKTEMLTSKTWQITARTQVTTDSAGTSTTDTSLDNCEKDDTYKFATDNKLTVDEGATKCNTTDPQSTTLTWAFADNETKLNLTTSGGFPVPGELIELTNSTLVVKSTIDIFDEKIVTTSTFTAQ